MDFWREYTEMQQFISRIQLYQDQIMLQNVVMHAAPEEDSMAERKQMNQKIRDPGSSKPRGSYRLASVTLDE